MRNSTEARVPRPGAVFRLYRDLWLQMRGERRVFVGAVVLLILAQVVLLSVPYISGRALNALQLNGTAGLREAGIWLSMVLLVACGSWLLHGPGRILERRAALLIRQRMSASLVERLFQLPLGWHEAHHSGATAHRVQQSTQALSGFAQSQFIYLNSAVRLLGPLIALWWVQPVIGFTALAGFALIVSSVVGFDRAMLRLANLENEAERRYSATLIDTLGNTGTVYALRQARGVAARLERRLLAVFVPLRRAIVLNEIKWCTVDLSTRVLNCCLVALFVWLATRATPGNGAGKILLLGSLYMVWEYAQQAADVVASIASHFQTFARQHADYASADIIRDTAPESSVRPEAVADVSWRRMTVRDLTFHHSASRHEGAALERLALGLERGKRYALIGASGSGKSTLMRVLAGLYPAERIALTLDDGPIRVSPAETAQLLRAHATLIPQDAEVYEGTLGENLGLCESVVGPPAANAYSGALEAACATDFVQATPIGLEAPVAERAANWSGGQRSRVALARGILAACGSDLVLLDEPTASLDSATEARVYTNLFAAFSDACVISSIHRLSLLSWFDEVLVMQDGRLVAQGSADELALTCPEFQRLTSLQNSGSHERFPEGHASVA
ncbi:MAG: transporter, ATP-binding protein [Gammaproteobacteria bacterium]|nr:transporter, ATP-binding protein [Gammaproteobacteria bacterium]